MCVSVISCTLHLNRVINKGALREKIRGNYVMQTINKSSATMQTMTDALNNFEQYNLCRQ